MQTLEAQTENLKECANLVEPETCCIVRINTYYLPGKFGFDTAENEPRQVCYMIRAREPRFQIASVPHGAPLFRRWRVLGAGAAEKGAPLVGKITSLTRRT